MKMFVQFRSMGKDSVHVMDKVEELIHYKEKKTGSLPNTASKVDIRWIKVPDMKGRSSRF